RRLQVDRVDTDADLLDQPQPRRRGDHRRRAALQHVPQHVAVRQQPVQRRTVALGADGDRQPRDRRKPSGQVGTGGGVEDDLHARDRPSTAPPAKRARAPRASSTRNASFHFAMRSPRVKLPTLSCPAPQPTARCTIVVSSVSPDRADTMAAKPASLAAFQAFSVSVSVPRWLGFSSTVLAAPPAAACRTRAASLTRKSSPTTCTRPPTERVKA